MRSLAHDMGKKLGCGAHLTEICRTAVGEFSIEQAIAIEEIAEAARAGKFKDLVIPLENLLANYPRANILPVLEKRVRHGGKFNVSVRKFSRAIWNCRREPPRISMPILAATRAYEYSVKTASCLRSPRQLFHALISPSLFLTHCRKIVHSHPEIDWRRKLDIASSSRPISGLNHPPRRVINLCMSSLQESASASASHETVPGFSRLVRIEEFNQIPGVSCFGTAARLVCSQLEIGNLLLLAKTPFVISQEDRELLLGRKQASSAYHKNIAYRPSEDRITGLDASEREEAQQLRRILRSYSQQAIEFVNTVLTPYANQWKLDYASFRPIEEKGRPARVHARNDLLHFDSFPTRPTNGGRILRLFTNINPVQSRVWLTSQTFEAFGPRYATATGLQSARKENFFARLFRPLAGALNLSIGQAASLR